MIIVLITFLFLFAGAGSVFGQAPYRTEGITPGTRIRISAPDVFPQSVTGTFISANRDSLFVSPGQHTVLGVGAYSVQTLEISAGRRRGTWAAAGALAGLLIGPALGGMATDDGTMYSGLGGFFAGLLLGPPAGALAGALAAPERWIRHSGSGAFANEPTSGQAALPPASASPALAAPTTRLQVGTAVRVGTMEAPRLRSEGTVIGMTADTLVLRTRMTGANLTYPLSQLASLELRGGEDRRAGVRKGAKIGTGVGLGLGVLSASGGGWEEGAGTASDRIGMAVSMGLFGALVGSAFGFALPPTGWVSFPLPARR